MFRGRFYFRLTTSGNLLGEYSNRETNGNVTESCNRVSGIVNNFVGEYHSCWLENTTPIYMKLKISSEELPNNTFRLEWRTPDNVIRYEGEGFIEDGMLIGWYGLQGTN